MKSTTAIRRPNYAAYHRRRVCRVAYPNAAGIRYHLNRLLDVALAAATTVGLVASLLFAFMVWG